ncbi:hypothetical protein QOZ80_5AG0367620 [Eleusine coracana subsp. coracana]|nr:hypothetical protein QOZ80_5AG0367620 [Eleusine coracana subsp. coracana]
MHCNHLHHHHHAPAFDARYCPPLLVPPSPAPAAPGCGYVHHHPAAATCGHRAPPALAPEQQYFMDRWGHRMGPGFTPASNGAGGGDHHAQSMLAPEHPSSQSTIWRPAASSCLEAGHRCDLCARRTVRTFAERGASLPPPSALPPASSPTAATVPDYSIYDLAAAMATARQCCVVRATQGGETAFQLVRGDRKRGALMDEAPDKKEVREIEFFPAASTHHGGGGGIDESEFVPPVSSSSYFDAGSRAAPEPHLDLSLRL